MSLLRSVSLVTGGAQGIGKAITELLLQNGSRVAMVDCDYHWGFENVQKLQGTYGKDNVIFIPCDVSSPLLLEKAFDIAKNHWKQLDIVVNNAGIANEGKWQEMIRINLDAVIHGTKLAFQHMSNEHGGNGGVVVNVSSIAGILPQYLMSAYCATKYGVLGYSRSLGVPEIFQKSGVRVNVICPSFTDTAIISRDKLLEQPGGEELVLAIHSRRKLKAEDIADGVLDLILDTSKNGAGLLVTSTRDFILKLPYSTVMSMLQSVSLVTGGAQGIGKAITELLLQNGGRVAILDCDYHLGYETLTAFKEKYGKDNVIFIPCDVSSPLLFEKAFKIAKNHWKQLDIVVNNAGIANEIKWQEMIRINLDAVIHGTKLAFQYMSKENGGNGGVVVNVSSLAGILPQHISSVYCATKFGVLGYSRSLGKPEIFKKSGVRVNAICPSFTDTAIISRDKMLEQPDGEIFFLAIHSRKILKAEAIADGVLELILDTSKNGAGLLVTKTRGKEYLDFTRDGRSKL